MSQLAPTSGTGPSTVTYVIDAQPSNSVSARGTTVWIAGQTVNITQTQPFMYIDLPVAAAHVTQPFALSGWAIDIDGSSWGFFSLMPNPGPGVDVVQVWAYPNPGSGAAPIFVGSASYGTARPDVNPVFGDQYRSVLQFGFFADGAGPSIGHLSIRRRCSQYADGIVRRRPRSDR